MKFMIKVLESAEFLVIERESLISAKKHVFVSLNISKWQTELVTNVLLTQFTVKLPKNVFVRQVLLRILDFVPLLVMLMNSLLMENVFVEKDTILLDIAVDSAHLDKYMTQPTEFVMLSVKTTKFGIQSSDHADVFLDITSSMESALNVTPKLKFIIKELNAVTVN